MNKKVVFCLLFSLVITGCSSPSVVDTQTEQAFDIEQTTVVEASPEVLPGTEVVIATEVLAPTETATPLDFDEVMSLEMRGSFDFFWEQANTEVNSPGYGLIRDRYPGSQGIASIAAVGFGLTAYLIGIEKGYVTSDEVHARVNQTLDTLWVMDNVEGFYYHFVDIHTGERAWSSEISSIDTAILLMGVLSVGEYYGGDTETKANQIYERVNWPWFVDESRDMFHMAYRPGEGFSGYWDFYAEQLMLYILAAGSNTFPIDDMPYYSFTRHYARFGDGDPFIHSWFGSIFTYQFSHAWIDFRGYSDAEGVDWFENSVDASMAQVNFANAMDDKYITLGPEAWGLSACDGPAGYNGLYGAPPSGYDNRSHFIDDTIPTYGAIGSIVFLPEEAQQAILYYYSLENLISAYGLVDSFNLTEGWYATDVIGIDKGITLLMLANYENDFVYEIMMDNDNILDGLERLQILKND